MSMDWRTPTQRSAVSANLILPLPGIDGTALHYVAWFGPLIVAVIAKVMLDRKYKPVQAQQATHAAAIQYLF